MKKITKVDVRKILNDFKIYKHEVFTIDDDDENLKIHHKEYYVWYNMIISFTKNNKRLYVKFEGEIPVALIEYIEKRYPNNEILSLYPNRNEHIKNCYTVLVNRPNRKFKHKYEPTEDYKIVRNLHIKCSVRQRKPEEMFTDFPELKKFYFLKAIV